jgi:hypothetical protein
MIVPGTSWSSGAVRDVTAGANFQVALENTEVILNRAPQPGEASEYRTRKITSQRAVHYGVVVQRTTPAGTRQLALAGIHTHVLVSFLTASASLPALEAEWRKAGNPADFEALIEAEVQGDTTLRARLAGFRVIRSSH